MNKTNGGRAGAAVKASRSIIFDAESIRAIRDGRKTQTRRVVTIKHIPSDTRTMRWENQTLQELERVAVCPYGRPGDLVWVKERALPDPPLNGWSGDVEWDGCGRPWKGVPKDARSSSWVLYEATSQLDICWKASRFMPRWASRLTLRMTDVRVQQVQDLCDSDAVDEGIEYRNGFFHGSQHRVKGTPKCFPDAPSAFADRWDAINAKRGYPWDLNPWVWALTFEPIWKNIDAVLKAEPGSAVLL